MKYALLIEYDGRRFSGWAKQRNSAVNTVQGTIEQAIYQFTNTRALIQGAGRTDAGVHAFGQVCHVDLKKSYELKSIRSAVNYYLQDHHISIVDAQEVDAEFHATKSATARYYIYRILCRAARPALLQYRCHHVRTKLNVDAMQEAANYLVGEHDFSSFRRAGCQAKTPIRKIFTTKFHTQDNDIYFHIIGSAFLYNQVRIIMGTLLRVGMDKVTPSQFKKILENCNRNTAGNTLSPFGLYLKKVFYPCHLSPFGHVLCDSDFNHIN